jgi:membrane-associated phospholipid phosphatase
MSAMTLKRRATAGASTGRDEPWSATTCLLVTTAMYATLYWLSNHLTGLRADVGLGVYAWESAIPFLGWTIVPYLSIVGFFLASFFVDPDARELKRHVVRLALVLTVSVVCYALFPLRFTFTRPPVDGVLGSMFDALTAFDLPYNRAPSLHIGVLVILWVRMAPVMQGWQRLALHAWFMLIAISVLTTYQHHVIDVPAGVALGAIVLALTSRQALQGTGTVAAIGRRVLRGAETVSRRPSFKIARGDAGGGNPSRAMKYGRSAP